MQAFDETYADQEFQQRIAQARAGWMDRVDTEREPDLGVEGLTGSMLTRLLGSLLRRQP